MAASPTTKIDESTETTGDDGQLKSWQRRRIQDRKEWDAYWKLKNVETTDTFIPRMIYLVHRFVDAPATWFREKIVEPLHDKHKMPYYHRRLKRIPGIDQCGVSDMACYYEANEQYRLDKLVDYFILNHLGQRVERCLTYFGDSTSLGGGFCTQELEDMHHADLNYFIKYGELGMEASVIDVYMKQKHRLIWQRRNPEIMAKRQKDYEEYLAKKKAGDFDISFWQWGLYYLDKKSSDPLYGFHQQKASIEGDKPLSKDWEYYKKVAQDPEFDKEQGKRAEFMENPW